MWNIQSDLIQLTKRLGRIAVAMWPPLLLLTLKPSFLPNILYLNLLPLHKWISRVMILASLLHSILYTYFFLSQGAFLTKMSKIANLWGVVAIILFMIIGITSLKHFRRYNFKLFYFTHYILTWCSILAIYLHSRPAVPYYTLLNIAILLFQIVYRFRHTTTAEINLVPISHSLTLLEFPLESVVRKPLYPSAHIRINIVHSSLWKRIVYWVVPLTHPFTVISLSNDSNTIKLLVRNGNFPLIQGAKYYVTGAFESNFHFMQLDQNYHSDRNSLQNPRTSTIPSSITYSSLHYILRAKKVLIVVGGSGISFGLPLLHILNSTGCNVRLIWVTRDYHDLNLLNYFNRNHMQGLEIYITGNVNTDQDIEINYYEPEDIQNDEVQLLPQHDKIVPATSYTENYELSNSPSKFLNNVGSSTVMNNDEIDFTNTYSSTATTHSNITTTNSNNKKYAAKDLRINAIMKNLEGKAFREPAIVEPPTNMETSNDGNHLTPIISNRSKVRIPSYIKVYYGRPELNNDHYKWCLQNECDPEGYARPVNVNMESSNANSATNLQENVTLNNNIDVECPVSQIRDEAEILSQVWVLAAGPKGLVNNTKRWADDYGLRFYCESYAI